MNGQIDGTVSAQWKNRPDDERFLTVAELYWSVKKRADNSRAQVTETKALKVYGTDEGELILSTELGPKLFTSWSFGQVASVAQGPAGYLKKLPAPLAAECLNHGLKLSERDKSMILVNGNDTLRAITSEVYGRIWDREVVEAVQKVTAGGSWQVPAASYATTDPKRATTLYASDRDVFMFLVDPEHPVELPGQTEPMFRGFYVWNSEVGSAVFGIATFLYERVCDNRLIWGQSNKVELKIRHTSGAPERFLREGSFALAEYAKESTRPLVERIQRARNIRLGKDEDEVKAFLRAKGLTLATAEAAINQTRQEGKDILNAWEISRGVTAVARGIMHTDARVDVERTAGKILTAAGA